MIVTHQFYSATLHPQRFLLVDDPDGVSVVRFLVRMAPKLVH